MVCIDEMEYKVLLSKVTFKECTKFIRAHFDQLYIVEPGFRIFDVFIIGVPPIYVAVDDNTIIFPYTKPCHGTFVLSIQSAEETKKVRKVAKPAPN